MVTTTASVLMGFGVLVDAVKEKILSGDNEEKEVYQLTAELFDGMLVTVYPALKLVAKPFNPGDGARGIVLAEDFDGPGRVLCIQYGAYWINVRSGSREPVIIFSVATRREKGGVMSSLHTTWNGRSLVENIHRLSNGDDDEFIRIVSSLIEQLFMVFKEAMEKNEKRHAKMAELAGKLQLASESFHK